MIGAGHRTRERYEKEEAERLAPFAVRSGESRGRVHAEDPHSYRTGFQRDRDRIIHCRAFRRLEDKTQVFVQRQGDHYRNRLTHTLEAAQIARTIARALRLNEDLAEAIALAHDLGHPPFGHAGERVLARLMSRHGGFDHNRQTLRVVDWLEERVPDAPGLNLCDETREGILKHGCQWSHPVPLPALGAQPSLEAQVANSADEIAYMSHDMDDALRYGGLELDGLGELPLVRDLMQRVRQLGAGARDRIRRARLVAMLIDALTTDLIEASADRLAAGEVGSPEAVRSAAEPWLGYSPEVDRRKGELKRFLYDNFYNHPEVLTKTRRAESMLDELFRVLRDEHALLPEGGRARGDLEGPERAVADYVAGMTDRFAIAKHRQLLDPHRG